MKGLAVSSPKEYLAILARRKWWLIVPTIFGVILAAFIALHLPDVFESEAVIILEPREVPDAVVKDLLSISAEQRLNALQQTILSRTNLLRIASEFQQRIRSFETMNSDQKVDFLKRRLSVQSQLSRSSTAATTVTRFRISFESLDPETAQSVASRVTSLFIEYDNRYREQQIFGTTEFLKTELTKVNEQLEEVGGRLRDLKQQYRFELPEYEGSNFEAMNRIQDRAKSNQDTLDRFISMRLSLERQVSETPRAITENPTGPGGQVYEPDPRVIEYREKSRLLGELENRYTDNHPDVRRLQADLERLEDEIPPEDLVDSEPSSAMSNSVVTRPNPVYQKLQSQLEEVKTEIEIRRREAERLNSEFATYKRRLQVAPERAELIGDVRRLHEELQIRQENLKQKLIEAQLAESVESKQKGQQFVILDPANRPLEPARPNRAAVFLMGLLATFGVALGAAVTRELSDQRVWSQAEIRGHFQIPVLAEIPQIKTEREGSRQKWRKVLVTSLLVVLLGGYCGGLYLLHTKISSPQFENRYLSEFVAWL